MKKEDLKIGMEVIVSFPSDYSNSPTRRYASSGAIGIVREENSNVPWIEFDNDDMLPVNAEHLHPTSAEFKTLRDRVAYLEKFLPRWNPRGGLWIIDGGGEIHKLTRYQAALSHSKFGTEFETEESAIKGAFVYGEYHRLYRAALELNGDWFPTDTNTKFMISKHTESNYRVARSISLVYGGIYFKSEFLANEAIRLLGLNNE